MQKIVIDTNVIVSSIIQNGYPDLILSNLFIEQKFILCISEELMNEYFEVLLRPKFSRFQDFFIKAENLLFEIAAKGVMFTPSIKLELITDDDDNMILELPDECDADFVITGNSKDFIFPSYKRTKIVTPRDYFENHKPQ